MAEPSLLVACGEPVGERMAGPAIRAWELSRVAAAAGARVTLAAPRGDVTVNPPAGVELVSLAGDDLPRHVQGHGAVLAGAGLLARFPALGRTGVRLAIDLYDPVPFEAAELFRDAPAGVLGATLASTAADLRSELRRADLVLCASERQRDLWTGALLAAGRFGAELARTDRALDGLVRVVPFGVAPGRPAAAGDGFRGRIDGVGRDDLVVLWGGGLHQWFDPELAVRAVEVLATELPRLRLVFMGSVPPNAALHQHSAATRTRALAAATGLLGNRVFFLDEWVPYMRRGSYFADADIGISTHLHSVETRYSWRTRLLDYLWAGLPVVASSGDALGEILAGAGAAGLSTPGDLEGLVTSLRRIGGSQETRTAMSKAALALADDLRWERVAAPFLEWVRAPTAAARPPRISGRRAARAGMVAAKGLQVLGNEGVGGIRRRLSRYRDRS
ncbi:MAG: glycosyltransferase family protein [Candidatus Dormibacteria bacterium]